jgi:hypothetical protein
MKVFVGGAENRGRESAVIDTNISRIFYFTTRDHHTVKVQFRDLVSYRRVTRGGDSGAIVLDRNNHVVGLHIGASDTIGYFMPIDNALVALLEHRFEIVTGDIAAYVNAAADESRAMYLTPTRDRAAAVVVLARTIFGEARNQPYKGMEAVAMVVVNRTKYGNAYGEDGAVENVCLKPSQFSCWNEGDPNRDKILAVGKNNATFSKCVSIAQRAVSGELIDETNGATHYHTRSVSPNWSSGKIPCFEVGDHIFFNDIDRPASEAL